MPGLILGGDLLAAFVECAAAIRRDQLLDGFDQFGQRGFGVAGDSEIGFDVASEILIVGFVVQLDGGNA